MTEFVHLHVHSEYSLLDGAIKIPDLIKKVEGWGHRAVALTDHGNLFGAIEFYQEAKEAGIKPIIGMEAYLSPRSIKEKPEKGKESRYYHLTLLVQNEKGFKNLMTLSSLSYLEGFYHKPRIDFELLSKYSEGLIALSGCLKGPIATKLTEGKEDEALSLASELLEIFGRERFYIELMQVNEENDRVNPGLLEIAKKLNLKIVATNDVHYLEKEDYIIQDVLLCIQTGKKLSDEVRLKIAHLPLYLRSTEEMAELFKDYPEALKNTLEIADKVELELDIGGNKLHLPKFDTPSEFRDTHEYLVHLAEEGLRKKLGPEVPEEYKKRLKYELEVIKQVGFSGYFLIIWDIVRKAREMDIPVGPGRGSAAGSLTLYALDVTRIDPLKYGLLFERFLNPERISPPDVDIDLADIGRDKVIDYVRKRFGEDSVAQIITFNKMKSKLVVRDVGRVLGLPYNEVDRIAKMIPQGLSLEEAMETNSRLKELASKEPYKKMLEIAKRIEGHVRNVSIHAAGIVIAPGKIWEYAPLYRSTGGEVSTQFDMKAIEALGLLKVDLLGLRTLTILKWSEEMARQKDPDFVLEEVPLNDRETFDLLSQGETWGVFQLESRGMVELVKRVEPRSIEDLMDILALYRPGPLQSGMVERYIRRRKGLEKVEYKWPELESILKDTYGVLIYQEQIMQIAAKVAGFSLGEADVLRKAMGKKIQEMMKTQISLFIERAVKRGVPEDVARTLIEDIVPFAGYGFNKSHAAGYSFISYWTAYMKAHYPTEFITANMSAEMNTQDSQKKIARWIKEAERYGIKVLPPDINKSDYRFKVIGEKEISFGLGAIKNVGEGAIKEIIKVREKLGRFKSFDEFLRQVSSRRVNKKVVEHLIMAGAFDSLNPNRKLLLKKLEERGTKKDTGLFDMFSPKEVKEEKVPFSFAEKLAMEKRAYGFYLTGHPLDPYRELIEALPVVRSSELDNLMEEIGEIKLVGMLQKVEHKKSRKGNAYMSFIFEDLDGEYEAIAFGDTNIDAPLEAERLYIVRGEYSPDLNGGQGKLRINKLESFESFLSRNVTGIILTITPEEADKRAEELKKAIMRHVPGSIALLFAIKGLGLYVSQNTRLKISKELFKDLKELLGEGRVRIFLKKEG